MTGARRLFIWKGRLFLTSIAVLASYNGVGRTNLPALIRHRCSLSSCGTLWRPATSLEANLWVPFNWSISAMRLGEQVWLNHKPIGEPRIVTHYRKHVRWPNSTQSTYVRELSYAIKRLSRWEEPIFQEKPNTKKFAPRIALLVLIHTAQNDKAQIPHGDQKFEWLLCSRIATSGINAFRFFGTVVPQWHIKEVTFVVPFTKLTSNRVSKNITKSGQQGLTFGYFVSYFKAVRVRWGFAVILRVLSKAFVHLDGTEVRDWLKLRK